MVQRELFADGDAEPRRPSLAELAARNSDSGLACSQCGFRHFWTIRSVPHKNQYVLRRRECRRCGHRFTTREVVLSDSPE